MVQQHSSSRSNSIVVVVVVVVVRQLRESDFDYVCKKQTTDYGGP